ncbi:MAG: TonB family protein [Candidatus Sulfotelmatobacter sp.]
MGYQALLFCPDEKTARTVTQVLSELDFAVVPCTEPFAAVKKLMGERFDAVVVDCDNEQNATLLFKSARNSPNNQSALAVAVVEGQAGVAKAFRIGANLVLTKPINVEQAKGTLRVARGLLRKGDAAKPPTAVAPAPAKPVTAPPTPARPVQSISSAATPRPAAVPPAPASIPKPRPMQPSFVASASSEMTEAAQSTESAHPAPKQVPAPSMTAPKAPAATAKIVPPAAHEPEAEVILGKPEADAAPSAAFSVTTSAGSASAAAPAREQKSPVSAKEKPSITISEPEQPAEKIAASASSMPVVEMSSPAPSFTFGGAVESGEKSEGAGRNKILLVVALIAVIAGGGYFAWTQWGPSKGSASLSPAVTTRPATATAAVPQPAPSTPVPQPIGGSSTAAAPASGAPASPSSAVAEPTSEATEDSSNAEAAPSKVNKQDHPSKANSGAGSSKPAASLVATNKAPAIAAPAQPIVIKNGGSQPVAEKAAPPSDAPAPSIAAIAPAGNGGPLPNLMGGANSGPAPVLQTVNVSQGVSQGLLIKKAAPSYPANALRMRIEGPVQLLATISKTGDISAVKVLSGDPNLVRAAVDAVKQWKYKPYLLDGSPVEMQTQITVSFKLPR